MEINWDGVAEHLSTYYILGDATMIKNKILPPPSIPTITINPHGTIEDVYDALCEMIQKTLDTQSNVIMPLSGGWDSRIIAGIVSDLGHDIQTYTAFHHVESIIAKKVCKKLGLTHKYINVNIKLNEDTYNQVRKTIIDYQGTLSFGQAFAEQTITKSLSNMGFCDLKTTQALHGGLANALLSYPIRYETPDAYCKHLISEEAPNWCKKISRAAHYKLLSGLDKKSMSVTHLAHFTKRKLGNSSLLSLINVYFDSEVISSIYSLPEFTRRNRHFQSHLLKKKFPKLNKIPSTNIHFPFLSDDYDSWITALGHYITRGINNILRKCRRSPFLGGMDLDYFVHVNRTFLMEKLVNFVDCDDRIPISEGIDMLAQDNIRHGGYILKILTCAILYEYVNG